MKVDVLSSSMGFGVCVHIRMISSDSSGKLEDV